VETGPVDAFSHLAVIAQVSATLLGFIAVFIVLSRDDGRFSESDKHFIQAMVLSGAYAFAVSLIPGTVSYFLSATALWMLSLGIAVLIGLASMAYQAWEQIRMSREEAAKIHWAWHLIAWGIGFVMAALLFAGLLGWAPPDAMYVTSATLSVILALWSFIAVVFRKFF